MAREKESYRDNLARLDAAFPAKELLGATEVAVFLGIDRETALTLFNFRAKKVRKYYRYYISKCQLAREMS